MTQHVLVVDDEEIMCNLLKEGLSEAGFLVTTVPDVTEALSLFRNGSTAPVPIDFLLTDFNMPRYTGLDLVDALKRDGIDLPCFLMSGNADEMLVSEAMARGCAGFIGKPFQLTALVEDIRTAIDVHGEPGAPQHFSV